MIVWHNVIHRNIYQNTCLTGLGGTNPFEPNDYTNTMSQSSVSGMILQVYIMIVLSVRKCAGTLELDLKCSVEIARARRHHW